MTIDKQTITSLITRLEEEYGKTTQGEWTDDSWDIIESTEGGLVCRMCDEVPPEPNRRLIIALHNSMPTLLSTLRHYMAVAEAAENVVENLRYAHDVFPDVGFWTKEKNAAVLAAYDQALDTSSN